VFISYVTVTGGSHFRGTAQGGTLPGCQRNAADQRRRHCAQLRVFRLITGVGWDSKRRKAGSLEWHHDHGQFPVSVSRGCGLPAELIAVEFGAPVPHRGHRMRLAKADIAAAGARDTLSLGSCVAGILAGYGNYTPNSLQFAR
jgi:hypothetical protein